MADVIGASNYEVNNGEDDSGPRVESGKVDIITSTYTS